MIRADYQVTFISPMTGNTAAILTPSKWQKLQYKRTLKDVGSFAITLPFTAEYSALAQIPDLIIEVKRRNVLGALLQKEETYLLRRAETFADDNGTDWLVLGGVDLKDLFRRRILILLDDPNSAGGYLTYADDCSLVMSDLINYQMINPQTNVDRVIPGLVMGIVSGGNYVYTRKQFGENLLNLLQELEPAGAVDFSIEHVSGLNMQVNLYRRGSDKSVGNIPYVVFTPKIGNILNPSIVIDRLKEINDVWVQGQGQDDDRVRYEVTNSEATASPYNLCEGTTDGRGNDDVDGLQTAGEAFLFDNKAVKEFTFEPDLAKAGCEYNVDWILGDTITVSYQDVEENLRITSVTVTLDENETIEIEVENEE